MCAARQALAPELPVGSRQPDQVRDPARLSPRRRHRRAARARFLRPPASRRKPVGSPRQRVLRLPPHRHRRMARYSHLGTNLGSVSELTAERRCERPAKVLGRDRAGRLAPRGQLAALRLVRLRLPRGLPARAECDRPHRRRSRDRVLRSLAQQVRIEACDKAPGRRRAPRFRLERGAGLALGLRAAAAASALRAVSAPRQAIAAQPSVPRPLVAVARADLAHRRVPGGARLPG